MCRRLGLRPRLRPIQMGKIIHHRLATVAAMACWWPSGGIHRLTPSMPRRQALWAIVRLMIANIVSKFAQLLQTIGRQRMSEVEQQGRRAVLVYY